MSTPTTVVASWWPHDDATQAGEVPVVRGKLEKMVEAVTALWPRAA
jgi:hypothetical protein